MNFYELKKAVDSDNEISEKIYICTFFTCQIDKMKKTQISLVKNLLGKYIVTFWLDYEYGRFSKQQKFKNKDLSANYAWQLYESLK